MLKKQEILLGRGAWEEGRKVKKPRRTALSLLCHVAPSLGIYGDGIIFWVVSNPSFWLRVLLSDACIAQARWTPVRRILGGDGTSLFSSGWWGFVSSMFLTRTSCCEITHLNGY